MTIQKPILKMMGVLIILVGFIPMAQAQTCIDAEMILVEGGTPGVAVGETFDVEMHFTDCSEQQGLHSVFAGFSKLNFDQTALQLDNISFAADTIAQRPDDVPSAISNANGSGMLGMVGAVNPSLTPITETKLATLTFTALSAGETAVQAANSDDIFGEVVVYGNDFDLREDTGTTFNNLSLTIDILAAPGLSGTPVSNDQIDLSWQDVTNETGYELQSREVGAVWNSFNLLADVTNFTDTELLCGVEYNYQVRGLKVGVPGPWSELIMLETGACPAGSLVNDHAANATAINTFPYNATLDTTNATANANEDAFTCLTGVTNTVWYRYDPTSSGTLRLDSAGSGFDTAMVVMAGTRGAWIPMGCVGNADATARLAIPIEPNTTYYIGVGGVDGAFGNLQLNARIQTQTIVISEPISVLRVINQIGKPLTEDNAFADLNDDGVIDETDGNIALASLDNTSPD